MNALLDGKNALVTGGGGAIGGAICRSLAEHGAKVYCLDLEEQRCAKVVEPIRAAGGDAESLIGDLTDRATAFALLDKVRAADGSLHILVNAAMWIKYQPLLDVHEEDVDRMLGIGLKATLWTMQAAVPLMDGPGASIVNVTSTAAVRPAPNQCVYSAIKGATNALTVQSSIELGERGIRVNAVAPGLVLHAGNAARVSAELVENRKSTTPLGRLGQPEDIAGAVLYLASGLSSFVSGVTITVDGGRLHAS